GEHTDYNGLPVLPFAIERAVLAAGMARAGGLVEVTSTDDRFGPRRYAPASPIAPFAAGDWGNYAKAATQALLDAGTALPPGGVALRVDGTVPLAAGGSSSSALVVALALAQLALAGVAPEPLALAEVLARGERYVGVLSGGMDQAAILLGRAGHALRLDFFPLRERAVAVPPDAAFVVAHTLEDAAKAGLARGHYNQRVIECRLACAVLAHRLRRAVDCLGALEEAVVSRDDLLALLPEGSRSRAQVRRDAGLSAAAFDRLVPATVVLADPDRFVLRRRVRHVLGEAARVAAAEQALVAGALRALGRLLAAAHARGAGPFRARTGRARARPGQHGAGRRARGPRPRRRRARRAAHGRRIRRRHPGAGRAHAQRCAPGCARRSLLPAARCGSGRALRRNAVGRSERRARRLPGRRVLGRALPAR